jgi:Sigma-70 region 2
VWNRRPATSGARVEILERLFRDHARQVFAYAARRAPDRADDVVAETFAIAWRRARSGAGGCRAVALRRRRFQDSTVQRLTLRDRLFLYVVPREHWTLGARPSYLVARDRSGRAVFRRFLYPAARCTYPDHDVRCRGIIYSGG